MSTIERSATLLYTEKRSWYSLEKEAFRLFREDTGINSISWAHFSDGYGAQFRYQYYNGDVMKAYDDLKLKRVSFHYFEANEGKIISDAV